MIPLKFTTPQMLAKAQRYVPQRRQLTGTRVGDFVALGKSLIFCPLCVSKFPARRLGYEVVRLGVARHEHVRGDCDWCRDPTDTGRMFAPAKLREQLEIPRRAA